MKRFLLFSILIVVSITLSVPARAAFEHQIFGVRPMGMGGAFTAVCNDSNALLWNPAGLVHVKQKEVTLMDSRHYKLTYGPELKSNFAGLVVPLTRMGVIGLGYTNFGNKDVLTEKSGSMSYAFEPRDMVALGLSVKRMSLVPNIDITNDPAIKQHDSFGADFGILFNPHGKLKFGAMVRNAGADIGDDQDSVSPDYTLGIAFQPWDRLTTAVDFVVKKDIGGSAGKSWKMTGGVEYLMGEYVALRGGYANNSICAGLGFKKERAQLDYAFFRHDIGDTHRASLTFRFGKEQPKNQLHEPEEMPRISKFPVEKSEQAFKRIEQEQVEQSKLEKLERFKILPTGKLEQQMEGYKHRELAQMKNMIESEEKLNEAEILLKSNSKMEIDEETARKLMESEMSPDSRKELMQRFKKVSSEGKKESYKLLDSQELQEVKGKQTTQKPTVEQNEKSVKERLEELKREKIHDQGFENLRDESVKEKIEQLKGRKLKKKESSAKPVTPQSKKQVPGPEKGYLLDARSLDKRFLAKNNRGQIFIDLRVYRDSFGFYERKSKSGLITLENKNNTISLKPGSREVKVNGKKIELSTKPYVKDHTVFIPAIEMVKVMDAKIKLPEWLGY